MVNTDVVVSPENPRTWQQRSGGSSWVCWWPGGRGGQINRALLLYCLFGLYPSCRIQQMEDMDESSSSPPEPGPSSSMGVPMLKIGGKRRSPDVDVIAEQLSHLRSSSTENMTPKRHCGEGGQPQSLQLQQEQQALPMDASFALPQDLILDLPVSSKLSSPLAPPFAGYERDKAHHLFPLCALQAVQTAPNRRVVKMARRSGVSDLLNSTVSDALGLGLL